MIGNAGLWTDGELTVVLSRVVAASWVRKDEDGDEVTASVDEADRFEITCEGDIEFVLANDGAHRDFRERAVSFLRALSLYWETRS